MKPFNRVALTFIEGTVFVSGTPLKATRKVWDVAMEIAAMLRRCKASELSFDADLTREELVKLGPAVRAAAMAKAGEAAANALLNAQIPGIEIREVDAKLEEKRADEEVDPRERVANFYASALVVLRRNSHHPSSHVHRRCLSLSSLHRPIFVTVVVAC